MFPISFLFEKKAAYSDTWKEGKTDWDIAMPSKDRGTVFLIISLASGLKHLLDDTSINAKSEFLSLPTVTVLQSYIH